MNLLGVSSAIYDGRAVLALNGELDLSTVGEAEALLARLVDASGSAPLVLDLRELSFMDSTGLRFVLAVRTLAGEQNRPFAIVRGPETVHRVFQFTMLEERLPFVDTPDVVGGGRDRDA